MKIDRSIYNVSEIARRCGVSNTHMRNILDGVSRPSPRVATALKGCGIDIPSGCVPGRHRSETAVR